ncbi:MAG: polysaccharide deacetylase family protein [Eubacteriales bacterium]|nr:polysaccharide deacetylase family protein [Eubacteriales bacterium]
MDKLTLRERRRRKRRQMMIRRCIRLGLCVLGVLLIGIFIVRGIILPIAHRGGNSQNTTETEVTQTVQDTSAASDGTTAETTAEASSDTTASTAQTRTSSEAVRVPLKGVGDAEKMAYWTPGWHETASGRWYQNADGTYYADGFKEIDGAQYCFNESGYIQTGWVTRGASEYYFNDDGVYDSTKTRPMLCLTFDDGPGQYTEELLDILKENNSKATFLMLGECVEAYPDVVKRMASEGHEIGNHSWDHPELLNLALDDAINQYQRTDQALIEACGQASTVCRAPYGAANQDIYSGVGKPFAMWSLDSLDWSYKDVDLDYKEVMNGDLTDGTIILMHDIHQPTVEACKRIIPELVEKGYRLVTFSEMAEAKHVTLQSTLYIDFWQSTLNSGSVAGYDPEAGLTGSTSTASADTSSEATTTEETTTEESYDDGFYDDSSYDE